jgi:glycosyltransferase involved in cell wall biosynthesis
VTAPEISVVMAVHDARDTVGEAVESILCQQGPAFEFIIIDDGSTDGGFDLLQGYSDPRVTVLRNDRNLGLSTALNRGLGKAKAPIIARMDADDVSLEGRLGSQLETLMRARADISFCRCLIEGAETGSEGEWREDDWTVIRWRSLFDNAFGPHPAVMFRRDAILQAGGYDEGLRRAQDYDLWDRCLARGLTFTYLPRPLLRYRVHAASASRRHGSDQAAAAHSVSRRALARILPDAMATEMDGLRWLMLGQPKEVPPETVRAGLESCADTVKRFLRLIDDGAPRLVWKYVAARLARRLKDLEGPARRRALARLFEASLRAASPASLARSAYAAVLPERI